MRIYSAKWNSFLRFAAAGTLLIWLSAVVACQAHCCGDDFDADGQVALHKGTTNSHDGDKNNHHDDSACLTLKSALHSDNGIALVKPNLHFIYSLVSVALSTDERTVEPALNLRQHKRCDWAFTPELSLGPALHSHAPPVLA